jgi:putative CocE/NonD family hydrolase
MPILMHDSFFDVESRGAFEAYQALRPSGAHLLVVGGHDGAPAGTDDGVAEIKAWFDHYLLGDPNGVDTQPPVQMLLPEGSRESYIAGKYERYDTTDWPVPGTEWESMYLSAAHPGISGISTNNGSLAGAPAPTVRTQSYFAIPTLPTASDVPNTGFAGPLGLNYADTALPLLTETTLAQPLALTYTSPKLTAPLTSAGPAALDVTLSSTSAVTAIWAVISDVWPNGTSHPLATGRLLSSYPNIVPSQSLTDGTGDVVQPFGDYSNQTKTSAAVARTYQIEFWPVGNVFRAGDRVQLSIVGASVASPLGVPAINTVRVGGPDASRLLLPVLP